MTHLRLALPIAGALLVAGCTRQAERSAAADTGTAQAPRTTEAPTAADDSARLVVTERGIGPLRAGMTVAEATAAVGGALVVPAGADTSGCNYLEWRGGPTGVKVMAEGGRVVRVDVTSGTVTTAAGARIGDDEARIQRLYGGRVAMSPHKYEDGHYLTVRDPADTAFALVFETAGGQVTRYRAGRRPQVEYVEGCA